MRRHERRVPRKDFPGVLPEENLRLVLTQAGKAAPGGAAGAPANLVNLPLALLKGDASHDGKVGFADLVMVAQNYGAGAGSASDFNGDGVVTFADLVMVAQNYGRSLPVSAAPSAASVSIPLQPPAPMTTAAPPAPMPKSAPVTKVKPLPLTADPPPSSTPAASRAASPAIVPPAPAPMPAIFNARKRIANSVWNS